MAPHLDIDNVKRNPLKPKSQKLVALIWISVFGSAAEVMHKLVSIYRIHLHLYTKICQGAKCKEVQVGLIGISRRSEESLTHFNLHLFTSAC